MKPDDEKQSEWLRQDFLDLVSKFGDLEQRMQSEVAEYKKTVNNALGLLYKEFLDFADKDVKERRARQKRQDIKDAVIGCIGLLTLIAVCSMIAALLYLLTQRLWV